MSSFFGLSDANMPVVISGVVAFIAFFLIARVADARQGIALAFGFTPLFAIFLAAAAIVILL